MAITHAVPTAEIDEILDILSTPEHDLEEIVGLAVDVCAADAAGITVRKDGQYHVPVTHGIEPFVCDADDTFCLYTMSTDGVFHVEDAHLDPRFQEIGWVDGRFAQVRFYASAPIYAGDQHMVGRLCVIDQQPKVLTALQRRTLETLALGVTRVIELRRLRSRRTEPDTLAVRQAAATLISQLTAELSHDLRVPLSSIIAGIEMLIETLADHEDATVSALLSRTARAAGRMERMLETSMELDVTAARLEAREVDLGKVARQLVLDSATLLETSGASIEIGELPVVPADPDDMYSVLQNLVTNAVKFGRPGVRPWVGVAGRRVGDSWRISVRDNGVGIPDHRRVDVFSLFSRVESQVEGHGIGLATVSRIIAAHGGRVGIDDADTGGAEVWFELPVPRRG